MSFARIVPVLISIISLAGCTHAPFTLEPNDSALIETTLDPGVYQMIELDAAAVSDPGAEVSLSVDGILLPPVYYPPYVEGISPPPNRFVSRLWAPTWPLRAHPVLKVVNHGPGKVDLKSLQIRHGEEEKIYRRSRENAPFPPIAWSDIRDVMEGSYVPVPDDPRAAEQISTMKEWSVQQRRRTAFAIIKGLPLPMRLDSPLIENLEVRGCALDAGGAIVAFSRPEAAQWQSIGPGWLPKEGERRWQPIKLMPPKVKGFEAKGRLFAITIFLGSSGGEAGTSGVQAKLYKIDSVTPLMTESVEDLTPEGRWVEFRLDPPQPPGEYLFELRATRGSPAWLSWNQESKQIAGSEWTTVVETLNVLEAPASARYDQPVPIRAVLKGSASRIDFYTGVTSQPQSARAEHKQSEMLLQANLFPGQTDIFYLRDYEDGD